jgi:hypothetical protein
MALQISVQLLSTQIVINITVRSSEYMATCVDPHYVIFSSIFYIKLFQNGIILC